MNGLLHLIKPLIDLSEPNPDLPAVPTFLHDAQDKPRCGTDNVMDGVY